MANKPVLIHLPPGIVAPEPFLKKVTVLHPTAFGFAGRLDGAIKFENSSKMPPLKEILELQTALREDHLLMWFANLPKSVLPDDAQPYILGDADNPSLAIFFTGAFDKYAGMDGDHTSDYCASDEAIFPRLQKALADVDNDFGKLLEQLRLKDGKLQKALCNIYDEHGAYAFLPITGEPILFGNNPDAKTFQGGWSVSDTCGYTEAVQQAVAAVKETSSRALSFLNRHLPSATSTTAPPPIPPDPQPSPPHPDADPDVTRKHIAPDHIHAEPPAAEPRSKAGLIGPTYPPPKMQKGKTRNLWLRCFNGEVPGRLPDDHESSTCAVYVEPELVALANHKRGDSWSKADMEVIAAKVHAIRKALKDGTPLPTDAAATATATAQTARDILVGKNKSTVRETYTPSAGASKLLFVLEPKDKEHALGVIATYLDVNNKARPSPLNIQQMESEWPVYSSEIGATLQDLLFLDPDTLMKLFDNNKKATAAFMEMRRAYINGANIDLASLVSHTKPDEGAVNTEVANDKPPVVAAAGATKPASGGALNFLRPKKAA